ncbi:MAG: tRNA uridine-5-carboxymethylaminomethyl(34) synthesis GTPase MnmE [Oscillospiraceae bacterium]|jgi:tRNA modification GTPase|nr:tRNA uridine-5-carboxymethylaminomethyl(34) synthesis GTPase MnmE [Oscillospiraceae bacterium]
MTTSNAIIAAIATPPAAGGIGIVRVSGAGSIALTARVFVPQSGADLTQSPGYRAHFGHVLDADGAVLDEALCLVFRAPHSYTGEDVAELHCHGGLYLVQRVLRRILAAGADLPVRVAEAGEFTRRAMLGGRISLAQAEAVALLIGAQNDAALKAASGVLAGALGEKLSAVTERVAAAAADVGAWVDYPDEDLPEPNADTLLVALRPAIEALQELLRGYDQGRILFSGADTVICGRPNTGKSTLMNRLCGFDRAIVTDAPGTTRDVLEESVRLGDIPLRLADTAGLRESADTVEQIGVARARARLAAADLVLCVLDGSATLTQEDHALLEDCADKRTVLILNKCDIGAMPLDLSSWGHPVVSLSAKTGAGLAELQAAVAQRLGTADFVPADAALISERQRAACEEALRILREAEDDLTRGVTLDAVSVLLEDALTALLTLRGQNATDAVTDAIFSRFCVGK